MATNIYVGKDHLPFFDITLNNPLQAADTATFATSEPVDFDMNQKIQIAGDHHPFGGFITKDHETDEGFSYDCMDWTRLLYGKIYKSFQNKTSSQIIIEALQGRGVNTGGITSTSKKYSELIFHSEKVVDVCHQLANLETNMEFFVNQDNVAVFRQIPESKEGYVFYPRSYSDLSFTQDSSNIITDVSVYGEDDRFLAKIQDFSLTAKYGIIEDIIADSSLKTADEGKAKGTELFNQHNKIEFSGSISTPLLPKMRAGIWIIIIPPEWSSYSAKAYYVQNVRTTINETTEEHQIDLLNGQPAPPSEWIYEAPGQTKGTISGNIPTFDSIISHIQVLDPITAKARELGDPRSIRRWIDANIQYQFYYDFQYTPLEVLQYRKGNCYDQSLLLVQMCQSIGVQAYRRCGQTCGGYAHCDAMVFVDGRWIVADVTCASRNQLV